MRAIACLAFALFWTAPALAQSLVSSAPAEPSLLLRAQEPQVKVGRNSFALPVVEYRAADGRLKTSRGFIVGRDIAPNTTVGLGFFRTKPKTDDRSGRLVQGRSRKIALGLTFRF